MACYVSKLALELRFNRP